MTVIGYAYQEAIASLRRSGRSALVSIGTIAIAFTTLGCFLLVSVNIQDTLDRWLEAAEISVYLHDNAADSERASVEQFLRGRPEVAEVEYVSKEQALIRFRADFPELADVTGSLEQNPFPSALEVRLRGSEDGTVSADTLATEVAAMRGVADVQFDRGWLERLLGLVASARLAGAVAAGILMLGAAFTVGAVVRLSLYARRDELEIMALVGAPFSYIRGPFVFEGLLLGGLGAAVALVAVAVLFSVARQYQDIRFLGYGGIVMMLLGGIAVGAAAGTLASRAAHR